MILLSPATVAERVVNLRILLPDADIYALMKMGPWLLLEEVAALHLLCPPLKAGGGTMAVCVCV